MKWNIDKRVGAVCPHILSMDLFETRASIGIVRDLAAPCFGTYSVANMNETYGEIVDRL